MKFLMISSANYLKVFQSVIQFFPIFMMDMFIFSQAAFEMFFHNVTMLKLVPASGFRKMIGAHNLKISLCCNASPAFPTMMFASVVRIADFGTRAFFRTIFLGVV